MKTNNSAQDQLESWTSPQIKLGYMPYQYDISIGSMGDPLPQRIELSYPLEDVDEEDYKALLEIVQRIESKRAFKKVTLPFIRR